MEKDWIVECWGDTGCTELFYTKKEALAYFNKIKRKLSKSQYIFTEDTITNKNDPDDVIVVSNLSDLG